VHCLGLELAEPFGIASHSLFQVTAASTADSNMDNTRMVAITIDGGVGLSRGTTDGAADDEIRVIGGRIHANERPPVSASGNIGQLVFNIGKNTNGDQGWSWTNSRNHVFRTPVIQPTTVAQLPTDWPKDGMRGFVTDATANTFSSVVAGGGSYHVPVYYDGSSWRIG
jgi:hypothetical protein